MTKKQSQWLIILRWSRTVRILFTLPPILYGVVLGVFLRDELRELEDLAKLALLYCAGLLFMLPAAFYVWHWRMTLDKEGLHRRRFFVWRHRSWAHLTRITQSKDAKGNEQLWLYFSEGKPWYLWGGYDGYGKAKMRLRTYRSIELRE